MKHSIYNIPVVCLLVSWLASPANLDNQTYQDVWLLSISTSFGVLGVLATAWIILGSLAEWQNKKNTW